jgi:hypothetical protein
MVTNWRQHLLSKSHPPFTQTLDSPEVATFVMWMGQFCDGDADVETMVQIRRGGPLSEPLEGISVHEKVWVCNHHPEAPAKLFTNEKTFKNHFKKCGHERPAEIVPSELWAQTLRSNRNSAELFLVRQ